MPTHRQVAAVVASRLAPIPQDRGIGAAVGYLLPVSDQEATDHEVPVGTTMPMSVRKVVAQAQEGTVAELVEAGLVPSAEVLATFAPRIAAGAVAAAYLDPVLRALIAEHYGAFRRRRTRSNDGGILRLLERNLLRDGANSDSLQELGRRISADPHHDVERPVRHGDGHLGHPQILAVPDDLHGPHSAAHGHAPTHACPVVIARQPPFPRAASQKEKTAGSPAAPRVPPSGFEPPLPP